MLQGSIGKKEMFRIGGWLLMLNKLIKHNKNVFRILDVKDEFVFAINCIRQTMPRWIHKSEFAEYMLCSEKEFLDMSKIKIEDFENLNIVQQKQINERFCIIADILPYISDNKLRAGMIKETASANGISTQTVRKCLCLYLSCLNKSVLLKKQHSYHRELSADEKNMRLALNKFFYNKNKNSLNTAYTFMLKEKYCDENGKLLPEHPSFYQFRYFYRKTRKLQNYYISRDGLKSYQRNRRPLFGGGVQP